MGRRAQGFRIFWKRGWAQARFTHNGIDYRIALRTTDPGEAQARAADEYARTLSGRRRQAVAGPSIRSSLALDVMLAEWIDDCAGVFDEETCTTLETYARHYAAFFPSLVHVTRESARDYTRTRLRQVLRTTVLKELTFLRGFLGWCVEKGMLDEAPVIDPPPGKATGVRAGKQRAVPVEITEEQALAIVAALPELSKRIGKRKWPVRARYRVAWETGLRPATLAALRAPEHYRRGAGELVLDREDDKARFGRTLPLSAAARTALDAVCPESGLLFGDHRFDKLLKAAARKVLGDELAARFAQYDFRHGRGSHLVGQGAPLTGVAFLFGHRRISTTDRYLKPSRRDAERALAAVGAPFPPQAPEPPRASSEKASNSGVTDGFRTRDNWSHNAPQNYGTPENTPLREDVERQVASENDGLRPQSRPGGGFLERVKAALGEAFAEELEVAEAWRRALLGAFAGDEDLTLGALEELARGGA